MINIKLDKTGGLTEALKLARKAQEMNLKLMVGNMLGSSLGMAPGFLVAQYCEFVDLDGPLYLQQDCDNALSYVKGKVTTPASLLWG